MRRTLLISFIFTVLSVSVAVSEERTRVEIDKPMIAGLSNCSTASQLDCIESVTVLTRDGKRLVATQTSVNNEVEKDQQQQVVETGVTNWEYVNAAGVTSSFILDSNLTTPSYVISGSNDTVEVISNADSESEGEESEEKSTTEIINSDTRYFEPSLSISATFAGGNKLFASKKLLLGERLEVVVRTSWLEIEEVFLPGKDSEVAIERTSQGKRITLRGSEDLIYSLQKSTNRLTGVVTESIVTRENFDFQILHPKSNSEQKQCFQSGYKVSATNGSSLSLFDEIQENSLTFLALGYPFKPDKLANKGYAKIRASLTWLSCKFSGNDIFYAKDFTTKVYSNDGAAKLQNVPATSLVKDGFLEIQVDEFLFAKTQIKVIADASSIAAQKAKAEADAKAKAEAEAKAAAELKAKQEAEVKAVAELKAKQEAEARAAADKAAADLKAKQEAEAAALAAAAKKKVTITCIKGKLTKRVTAVKPKCPKGYKKK